jgi:1,4-dihydroxy-2-naphthoate octaprenyltransferase
VSKLTLYLGVIRAPFLLLPVTLVASGAAAAAYDDRVVATHALLALLGLVALHASVNALNESSDMRTGIDQHTVRTPFSGGSGTLPSGALSTRAATVTGLIGAGIGLGIGLWFLPRIGWPLVPVMVLGGVSVLAYTEVFARLGVGEFFAGLGLGALPVVGTALVQRGQIGPAAWMAAAPAFFMTFNLLLLNEFPDEEADRAGGRRNLVLLLGRRAAALIYALAAIATPASIIGAVLFGTLPALALIAVLPFKFCAPAVRWALTKPHEPVPIPSLAGNVSWNLATNTTLAIALAVATWLKL